MNALNKAIEAANALAVAGIETRSWGVHTVQITAPCGATVQVGAQMASGMNASSIRTTYKVNGKRAKAADVQAMFAEAAPVVATRAMRQRLGALVGM